MQGPSPILSLLPLLLITFICFLFAIPIVRRKGRSIGFAALCPVPFLSPFMLLYLGSLTDKAVLDQLAALESKPS